MGTLERENRVIGLEDFNIRIRSNGQGGVIGEYGVLGEKEMKRHIMWSVFVKEGVSFLYFLFFYK